MINGKFKIKDRYMAEEDKKMVNRGRPIHQASPKERQKLRLLAHAYEKNREITKEASFNYFEDFWE